MLTCIVADAPFNTGTEVGETKMLKSGDAGVLSMPEPEPQPFSETRLTAKNKVDK